MSSNYTNVDNIQNNSDDIHWVMIHPRSLYPRVKYIERVHGIIFVTNSQNHLKCLTPATLYSAWFSWLPPHVNYNTPLYRSLWEFVKRELQITVGWTLFGHSDVTKIAMFCESSFRDWLDKVIIEIGKDPTLIEINIPVYLQGKTYPSLSLITKILPPSSQQYISVNIR